MSIIKMNFDTEVAKKVGTDSAIILSNIEFWIGTNKANKRHFYDDNYWMYSSGKAFNEVFDYLSESQIKTCLNKLVKFGYLEVGNHNKKGYDRTKWYCIPLKSPISDFSPMHLSEIANPLDEIRQPIPDYKTDLKKNNNVIDFEKLKTYFNKVYSKKSIVVTDEVKKAYNLRIKDGYSKEDIVKVIDNCYSDNHHRETNYKYVTLEFLSRPKIFERYASMEHKKPISQVKDGHINY